MYILILFSYSSFFYIKTNKNQISTFKLRCELELLVCDKINNDVCVSYVNKFCKPIKSYIIYFNWIHIHVHTYILIQDTRKKVINTYVPIQI